MPIAVFEDAVEEKCTLQPCKLLKQKLSDSEENEHPNVVGLTKSLHGPKPQASLNPRHQSYAEVYQHHWSDFVDEAIALQSGSITAADVLLLEQLTAALSLDAVPAEPTGIAANTSQCDDPDSESGSPISESERNAGGAELVAIADALLVQIQPFDADQEMADERDDTPGGDEPQPSSEASWGIPETGQSAQDEVGSIDHGERINCSPSRSESIEEYDMSLASLVSVVQDSPEQAIVELRSKSVAKGKWTARTVAKGRTVCWEGGEGSEVDATPVLPPRTSLAFAEMRAVAGSVMSSPESISSASDSEGGHDSDPQSSPEAVAVFKRARLQLTHAGRKRKVYNLKIDLHQHQYDAVTWMQCRERGESTDRRLSAACRKLNATGGILADDMGLGKTVCCLAVVVRGQEAEQQRLQEEQPQKGDTMEAYQTCRTLVVAPLSLLGQWEKEIKQKTNLSVYTHHGKERARAKANGALVFDRYDVVLTTYDTLKAKEVLPVALGGGGWRRKRRGGGGTEDSREAVSLLHTIQWGRVVLDEAHLIANHRTARFKAACGLQAKARWCLSGTPIQNSKDDLKSLFRFIGTASDVMEDVGMETAVSCLVMRRTVESIRRDEELERRSESEDVDESGSEGESGSKSDGRVERNRRKHSNASSGDDEGAFSEAEDKSKQKPKPRKSKLPIKRQSSLPLPPKHERVVRVDFKSAAERQAYDSLYTNTKNKVIEYTTGQKRNSSGTTGRRSTRSGSQSGSQSGSGRGGGPSVCSDGNEDTKGAPTSCMHIFELLLRLRQVCNHRSLVEGSKAEATCSDGGGREEGGNSTDASSTKISALVDELRTLSRSNRSASFSASSSSSSSASSSMTSCLVISEWPSFLDLLGQVLERKPWVQQCLQLDGRMSKQQRDHTLDCFEHPPQQSRNSNRRRTGGVNLLLLSTRAGGVGLNLVTASHVFIMEPSWNPFQEEQAIGRCHRIGQKNPVHVVRFLIADTIEDKVVRLKRKKLAMAKDILGANSTASGSSDKVSGLGVDEIKAMFQE
jgi:DNA repair protein RAD16